MSTRANLNKANAYLSVVATGSFFLAGMCSCKTFTHIYIVYVCKYCKLELSPVGDTNHQEKGCS